MDQFDQMVGKHHLAGCDRHILADRIGQRLQFGFGLSAGIGQGVFEIFHIVLPAFEPAFALAGNAFVQHFRIGQRPVGGRQGIEPLAGEEVHHLPVMVRHALDLCGFPQHIGLGLEQGFDGAVGILRPRLVGKTRIGFGRGREQVAVRLFQKILHQQHLLAR